MKEQNKPTNTAPKLEELHVHERINAMLNIINKMPLQGFNQWNPAAEVMKGLAALDNDFRNYEEKMCDCEEKTCENKKEESV